MTRIVGGVARGRRLSVPRGRGTRPTSDRAREALFSTLSGLVDPDGVQVLDLYAGSGAVGLEALSRGAARVVLVECAADAAKTIMENIATVDLPGATMVRERVDRYLARPPERPEFDVVFADPPYDLPQPALVAELTVVATAWLRTGGIAVVERPSRGPDWTWPHGIEPVKERRYGEGMLWYGRRI